MNVETNHELVVLVDSDDASVGVLGKIEVHQRGVLHRALSVSISDSTGRLVLQKRALAKYHSWRGPVSPWAGGGVQRNSQYQAGWWSETLSRRRTYWARYYPPEGANFLNHWVNSNNRPR